MCGRFAVGDPDGSVWDAWLGLDGPGDWPAPSWNVAPTQTAAVVVLEAGARRLRRARWGLVPRWWRKPLAELRAATFNARSEEAAGRPMFRDAFARARCLVPALGYYEWTGAKGAKQPWFVTLRRNTPGIALAGLWSEARLPGPAGPETVVSFTVLTTAAGPATAHLHPRTPVILDAADWARWLTPGTGVADLLHAPLDARVDVWPVDPAVGRTIANGPALIARHGLPL